MFRAGVQPPLRAWVSAATAVGAAGVALHAVLLAPAFLGEHPAHADDLTVLTLNARRGGVDAAEVVRQVRAEVAQLVVVEEVTPSLRQRLADAGLEASLPYVGGAPGPVSSGTMVFSAYPLTGSVRVPLDHGSYQLRVAAPVPFWLVAVHLAQPLDGQGSSWRRDWSVLEQVTRSLDGDVLVVGDFNSTLEHRGMRRLLDQGFVDAARRANAGWQPTYPSSPGLIAIDHVLSRGGYAAGSARTAALNGTDHRALVVRFAAPGTSLGPRK
ncbi:MAG: endonuclease/exonuclease/phosphatase family protein [Propionibacteriales bacterium]|nr:endonuclease/exonuclease/phosphatase family protein [Propionibacteriales bacterium]